MRNKLTLLGVTAASYSIVAATRVYAACDITGGAQSGANCAQGNNTPTDLTAQIRTITNTMLFAIGIIAVIMIVIGGIRYVLSGGNGENTKAAQETILYAVIGLVVALLSFAIVNFVLGRF